MVIGTCRCRLLQGGMHYVLKYISTGCFKGRDSPGMPDDMNALGFATGATYRMSIVARFQRQR